MSERLTLMAVHAHPDDEAIGTGGTFVRYKAEGVRTVLVTCTLGEEGEIVDQELDTPENRARLAEIRHAELTAAIKHLGIDHLELLPYRDSGMAGTPSNQHPESFAQADLHAATGRMVQLVRQYRPQVLVTYNEHGGYGHPDHINAHTITVAAFDAAGDSQQYPDAGEVWTPSKLYYISARRTMWLRAWTKMRERDLPSPLDAEDFDTSRFVDDPRITTTIAIRPYLAQKLAALREHRSQIRNDWLWLGVPEDVCSELLCTEYFVRVAARVPVPEGEETDLFAGLR